MRRYHFPVAECPHTDATLHVADETLFAHCPQCGVSVEFPCSRLPPSASGPSWRP
jgi:hypothetical protein